MSQAEFKRIFNENLAVVNAAVDEVLDDAKNDEFTSILIECGPESYFIGAAIYPNLIDGCNNYYVYLSDICGTVGVMYSIDYVQPKDIARKITRYIMHFKEEEAY